MPSPDQSLRRLVFDLGALSSEDAAAVLDQLEPAHRKKVESLLRELSGFGFGQNVLKSTDELSGIDVSRLSPWLVNRMKDNHGKFDMTPAARAILRECAARGYPTSHMRGADQAAKTFGRKGKAR